MGFSSPATWAKLIVPFWCFCGGLSRSALIGSFSRKCSNGVPLMLTSLEGCIGCSWRNDGGAPYRLGMIEAECPRDADGLGDALKALVITDDAGHCFPDAADRLDIVSRVLKPPVAMPAD